MLMVGHARQLPGIQRRAHRMWIPRCEALRLHVAQAVPWHSFQIAYSTAAEQLPLGRGRRSLPINRKSSESQPREGGLANSSRAVLPARGDCRVDCACGWPKNAKINGNARVVESSDVPGEKWIVQVQTAPCFRAMRSWFGAAGGQTSPSS